MISKMNNFDFSTYYKHFPCCEDCLVSVRCIEFFPKRKTAYIKEACFKWKNQCKIIKEKYKPPFQIQKIIY